MKRLLLQASGICLCAVLSFAGSPVGGGGGGGGASVPNALSVFKVSNYATGGDGTSGNPWTGWDTHCPWAAYTSFDFTPNEYFAYSNTLELPYKFITVNFNDAHLIFSPTTDKVGIEINGGSTGTNFIDHVTLKDLDFTGNSHTTDVIWTQLMERSTINRVTAKNFTGYVLRGFWLVGGYFPDIHVSTLEQSMTVTPAGGIFLGQRGPGEYSTTCVIVRPVVEGTTGWGINLDYAKNCSVISGTVENGSGGGVLIGTNSQYNTIIGMDNEVNGGYDFSILGSRNTLQDCIAPDGALSLNVAGNNNMIINGAYDSLGGPGTGTMVLQPGVPLAGSATVSGESTIASGQTVLGSTYDISAANGTYVDAGLAVTLPSAGTYKITADLRSTLSFSGAGAGFLAAKLYNSTDAADVANSEQLLHYSETPDVGSISTTSLNRIVTVSAGKMIKIYVKRDAASVWAVSSIDSDSTGRSAMSYIQLQAGDNGGGPIIAADDFNDNTISGSIWSVGSVDGDLGTVSVAETGGQLRITPASSGTSISGYVTTSAYNFAGHAASVQMITPVTQVNSVDSGTELAIGNGAEGNKIRWVYENGLLIAQKVTGGSYTSVGNLTYDASAHAYWRIRESGGTTYWDTSANGANWTTRFASANAFSYAAVKISLDAVAISATGSNGTAVFDNFVLR